MFFPAILIIKKECQNIIEFDDYSNEFMQMFANYVKTFIIHILPTFNLIA